MGFKPFCCNLCALFSAVGVVTYFVLVQMVANRNLPVIEHKFKMRGDDEEGLGSKTVLMYNMAIVMVFSSFICIYLANKFTKEEAEQEAEE